MYIFEYRITGRYSTRLIERTTFSVHVRTSIPAAGYGTPFATTVLRRVVGDRKYSGGLADLGLARDHLANSTAA